MSDDRIEKNPYAFRELEAKWQQKWRESDLFHIQDASEKPKFYALTFFPYPSGAGISVGHCRNYVPVDVSARFKTMKGFNVLNPMGWDAFGQPAENEAIKLGRNPKEMVPEYAANYKRQLSLVGNSYDWSREIDSSKPEYYRWTQWFFLLLHKQGLATRGNTPINWCPSCKTGLANEEVVGGKCWRCGTTVEKRPMPQWYFNITAYADRLISGLDAVDWPEGIKIMQREWIGRSEGAEVEFPIAVHRVGMGDYEGTDAYDMSIRVFTTRPDTLWGATFMVLAPEHPLVDKIATEDRREAIETYRADSKGKTDIERQNAERVKTGAFTGGYAVNPVNGENIPVWIADYVLMGYGTGAIMAVPAHDQRDFEFARKFNIPIVLVYKQNADETEAAMTASTPGGGFAAIGPFAGAPNDKSTVGKVIAYIEEKGFGKGVVNYRLRDWLISRQRYWGAPIPMIHCEACGIVPVPEKDLPVLLPDVEKYQPSGTGESPLASIPEFVNVACPACGGPAKRETDTMAGFACSSWYFLRFADPHNSEKAFSAAAAKYWLPVDNYVGGAEHAVMHLLYARFWTKVMFDAGLIDFEEPFAKLRNQGMMLANTPGRAIGRDETIEGQEDAGEPIENWKVLKKDEIADYPADKIIYRWVKMSKSLGNVVTPDEMALKFGADSLRVYTLFVAPFEETVLWKDAGMEGANRWVNRVWRLWNELAERYDPDWKLVAASTREASEEERKLRRKLHQTIRKVGDDIENFRFNTCVAALMEFTNSLYAFRNSLEGRIPTPSQTILISEILQTMPLLLSPITPHIADEFWARLGKPGFTFTESFPDFDPEAAAEDVVVIVLQINGKLKDRLTVETGTPDEEVQRLAFENDKIKAELVGKEVRKIIAVPGKLVNIVAG